MNTNNFVGYLLSIECKNVFYQGIVNSIDVDKDIIYLKNCFQNAVSCGEKIIEIKISEIDNIDILADPKQAISMLKPKAFSDRDAATSNNNTNNRSASNNSKLQNNNNQARHHSEDESRNSRRRNHQNGHHNNHNYNNFSDDDRSFDNVNVKSFRDDFDFEKNLALFDKNAFYVEMTEDSPNMPMTSSSRPQPSDTYLQILATKTKQKSSNNTINSNHIANNTTNNNHNNNNTNHNSSNSSNKNNDHSNSSKNYRFDEMILDTGDPINFQQIQVPRSNKCYVTDEGYVVPCIDLELRTRLFEESYKQGLDKPRQIECMGRCCAEMALQLVGGSVRFSVKNSHQKPSFLILANCNSLQGAYSLCTARLLANRNAKIYTIVYNSNGPKPHVLTDLNQVHTSNDENVKLFLAELALFRSTDSTTYRFLRTLDEIGDFASIDLIINGLESSPSETNTNTAWFKNLSKHIEASKACVLTIDPCGGINLIQYKWCISPVLPLENNKTTGAQTGRVFLCDLGFTKNMFQVVNIKYQSPFGSKFFIPLHND